VRIDRSDPADEYGDARTGRRALPAHDDPDAAGRDNDTTVSGDRPPDSSPARPDSALRTERSVAYRADVVAVYRQYAIEASAGKPERETTTTAMPRIEAQDPERHLVLADKARYGGDVPDDPRNHSNPKTGRFDASWSTYDRAIAVARERAGGEFGPNSIKMYDYSPETGEGTGTLIGEQAADRLRGWRIDGKDGHVNWWDWTGGKKGAGGVYGHDWFPEDTSTPGSRYIGWAPWQDSDGNILEGN
jgi:hypothetical protein